MLPDYCRQLQVQVSAVAMRCSCILLQLRMVGGLPALPAGIPLSALWTKVHTYTGALLCSVILLSISRTGILVLGKVTYLLSEETTS